MATIIQRNLSGLPTKPKPSAKSLLRMEKEEDYKTYQASLPPPVTIMKEKPLHQAVNAQMEELTRYFDMKRSMDEAHRSIIRSSQNAKMENLVNQAQQQILKTYNPTAPEVQEAFFLAQTDPNYFHKYTPNIELMRGLASLYVEKGLMVPKELRHLAPRSSLTIKEEGDILDKFKAVMSELETEAANASTNEEYDAIIRKVTDTVNELENTSFLHHTKEQVLLLSVAKAILDTTHKRLEDSDIPPLHGLTEELESIAPSPLRSTTDTSMVPTATKLKRSLQKSGIGYSKYDQVYKLRDLPTDYLESPPNEARYNLIREWLEIPTYAGAGVRSHKGGYAMTNDEILKVLRETRTTRQQRHHYFGENTIPHSNIRSLTFNDLIANSDTDSSSESTPASVKQLPRLNTKNKH